jgi:hypothetical protein
MPPLQQSSLLGNRRDPSDGGTVPGEIRLFEIDDIDPASGGRFSEFLAHDGRILRRPAGLVITNPERNSALAGGTLR